MDGKKTVGAWRNPELLVSEPVFVPKGDKDSSEDDGVVLSLLTKKKEPNYAGLLILDARDMSEVARVDFRTKGSVTPTLHGLFNKNGNASVEVFK